MVIAIDFDGTCVTHEFPKIGRDIGAAFVLKKLIEKGHNLILYTMRSGKALDEALKWFSNNDIELYAVNENPEQKTWTASKKVFAHMYIDDSALGCPLMRLNEDERPFVDWIEVALKLYENYIIYYNEFVELRKDITEELYIERA